MFQTGNMHSGIASLQSIMNGNDDVALLKASSDLESRARVRDYIGSLANCSVSLVVTLPHSLWILVVKAIV